MWSNVVTIVHTGKFVSGYIVWRLYLSCITLYVEMFAESPYSLHTGYRVSGVKVQYILFSITRMQDTRDGIQQL